MRERDEREMRRERDRETERERRNRVVRFACRMRGEREHKDVMCECYIFLIGERGLLGGRT